MREAEARKRRYAFVEFRHADDASRALATMHMRPLDSKFTFMVNRFTDFERYLNLDEAYAEPPPEEYVPKVCDSIISWQVIGHKWRCRSICGRGSPPPKAAINMLHIDKRMSQYTGMASPLNQGLHMRNGYVATNFTTMIVFLKRLSYRHLTIDGNN